MNARHPHPHPLETHDGRRALNAEGLLRQAYVDLASANRRLARLIHAMQTVEEAILADPSSDVVTKSLASVLREARESK